MNTDHFPKHIKRLTFVTETQYILLYCNVLSHGHRGATATVETVELPQ
jgi:hypothetical protein